MIPHSHNYGESITDISVGVILSVGASFLQYGQPLIYGALGAVGSILVRVVYKKYFKKYFEPENKL